MRGVLRLLGNLRSTWNRFNLLPLPPMSNPLRFLFLSTESELRCVK